MATTEVHPTTSLATYRKILGALLVLTLVTVGVAFLDLGLANNAVALGVAVTKAVLVVLFFMHVRHSDRLTWVFVGAGFFWLVIFFVLTFADYATRGPVGAPTL